MKNVFFCTATRVLAASQVKVPLAESCRDTVHIIITASALGGLILEWKNTAVEFYSYMLHVFWTELISIQIEQMHKL